MNTLLQSKEIPHSPEEACLELWSMQDSLSSKCCPLTTLEMQKACDLVESTGTSASDSPFIGEESGQPNQGTTQSRGHTLYLRSKGPETVLNFYLQIQEFGAIGNIRYY